MHHAPPRGAFGIIVPCAEDATRVWKVMCKEKTPACDAQAEFDLMRSLSHPNIVRAHRFVIEETRTCILMDHAGLDILSGAFPAKERVQDVFVQMLSAVMHMHQCRIAHRDLKLENVLVDAAGLVRITDFGLSLAVPVEQLGQPVCETALGSRAYAAPEMWKGPYDPFKCDVWSLGMMLYALWFERLPFADAHTDPRFGRWRGLVRVGDSATQAFAQLHPIADPPDWVRERIDEMFCLDEARRVSFL